MGGLESGRQPSLVCCSSMSYGRDSGPRIRHAHRSPPTRFDTTQSFCPRLVECGAWITRQHHPPLAKVTLSTVETVAIVMRQPHKSAGLETEHRSRSNIDQPIRQCVSGAKPQPKHTHSFTGSSQKNIFGGETAISRAGANASYTLLSIIEPQTPGDQGTIEPV